MVDKIVQICSVVVIGAVIVVTIIFGNKAKKTTTPVSQTSSQSTSASDAYTGDITPIEEDETPTDATLPEEVTTTAEQTNG